MSHAARIVTHVPLGLLVLVTLAMLATLTPWARLDAFPALSTYGYSIGTNTAYCSVAVAHWHPEATCEHAS